MQRWSKRLALGRTSREAYDIDLRVGARVSVAARWRQPACKISQPADALL
jgi:hypothetical protein